MHSITNELPRAIRFSGILSIIFLIFSILTLIFFVIAFMGSPTASLSVLIPLLFIAVQYWLFRAYNKACKLALDSTTPANLELACRKQASIVKFYGVLSFLFLLFIIFTFLAGTMGAYEFINFANSFIK